MFLEYFVHARDFLQQRGLKPAIELGERVSESDLEALDVVTDLPMPTELRQFYLEHGDGFHFTPDTAPESDLVGWEHMWLSDHRICNTGFAKNIEDEAMREIGHKSPRSDPRLLRQEMEIRQRWIPFYGFVGGGDYLCLDLSSNPPAVRFYESLYWTALPRTWDFCVASSLTEFVERWGRYHFISPAGAWTSFCGEESGRFDWAPEHFPKISARPSK